jgi:hypothetical protein
MMEVLVMKDLCSLSAVALALTLGLSGAVLSASTAEAQQRARVTVYGPGYGYTYGSQEYYEARMAMCAEVTKGLYRTQQDGYVFPYGYCLSDVDSWSWRNWRNW